MAASKLSLALRLAELGFHILPCQANSKNPKPGFNWGVNATTDAETIKKWFEADPNMNYGVCPRNKGVIIDLDVKPEVNIDGRVTWENTVFEHDDSVETLEVTSPSGGIHLYFTTDTEVGNAHEFGNDSGIDVRGAMGYVIGPGCSLGEGKDYVVTKGHEIASAPSWLVAEYLKQPGSKASKSLDPLIPLDLAENVAKAESYLATHPPAVEGMNGNNHTYELATMLRDFGLSQDKCFELMLSTGWNDRCQPPWSYEELQTCISHAYRYGQNRPGEKADIMAMFENQMSEDDLEQFMEVQDAKVRRHAALELFLFDQFITRGKRRDYIIPGWLPSHGFTALNAARGVGKSTIMLDLACRMAKDMDWDGLPIKKGYTAIYLCGEDDEGLELNAAAWVQRYGNVPPDRLIVADGVTNLMSREHVENCLQGIRDLIGQDRKCVVFLDTWQRATMAAGQNKDEDMQLCVKHAEQLAELLGGPLVGAFHPPKDGRETILGSSIIENSSTAIWHLKEFGTQIRLEVTRIKGSGRHNWRTFKFDATEMAEKDEFGKNRIGIVPLKTGGKEEETVEQEAEYERQLRAAWGWAIRGVDEWHNSLPPEQRNSDVLAMTPLANNIALLATDQEWAAKWMKPLKDMNHTSWSRNTVFERIKHYFFSEPLSHDPCELKDGTRIVMKKKGKKLMPTFELPKTKPIPEAEQEELEL